MTANINALKDYFSTGATQTYAFRLLQLERLKKAVMDSEKILYEIGQDEFAIKALR